MWSLSGSDGVTWRYGVWALCLWVAAVSAAGEGDREFVQDQNGERPKPMIAVDNVCAWPNLTVLRDGDIVATIHNQPSHLKLPADVDCWASHDGGRTWEKRGTPAPRDNERAARGHVAAGLARNGDLLVITTGWSDPAGEKRGSILPAWVSRSADGGRTWTVDGSVLLSYGNRVDPKGVDVRFSDDEGTTWSSPFRVVGFLHDGGYPSSVQLLDGRVVTAYYASEIEGHNRYHMGVVVWDPAKTRGR